jgi:hypothetical protein
MSQTLQSYITSVRYLLHDANANFYTNNQLTDYVNGARARVVRDTGCLRTIQTTQIPCAPGDYDINTAAPILWQTGTVVASGDYVFSNIYIYLVTSGGTLGTAPDYPNANNVYPPDGTIYTDTTVSLQYAGPSEIINYASLPSGVKTLDVININLYWGNSRIPLRYMAWTDFNAQLRYWQNRIGTPVAYSIYGQSQIYIGPVPDISYTADLDTILLPTDLVALDDVDNINDPYSSTVKFYAAYLAKYYEQSFGEAEVYLGQYKQQIQSVQASVYTRRLPDPYSRAY